MVQYQKTGFHPLPPAISLVSPLPLNRITSNLVSTESPYQGESSDVGYETWGRVSIEDVRDYWNGTLWIKFKILLASKLGPLSSGPLHPPSIPQRFGQSGVCFWGRNVGFISRICRVWRILG